MCFPKTLSIPTTKTKAALVSFFILWYLFFLVAVESLPLRIRPDHLCQRTSLGLRKTLLKSFFFLFFFFIWNAVDYTKCRIFSRHFPRDDAPTNSSHIPTPLHFPHAECRAARSSAAVIAGRSRDLCLLHTGAVAPHARQSIQEKAGCVLTWESTKYQLCQFCERLQQGLLQLLKIADFNAVRSFHKREEKILFFFGFGIDMIFTSACFL